MVSCRHSSRGFARILGGRLLDPRWLPAASDSLRTLRDKTVRKRPSNPSVSAIFPLFLGSIIVFLLLPPLHGTTKICGLKHTHHENLLIVYRTPRCVFFRISPSSSECCPNKEPNLQSGGRKNWRKTSLPVTNWRGKDVFFELCKAILGRIPLLNYLLGWPTGGKGRYKLPRSLEHIPPWQKNPKSSTQNCLGRYISSQEGTPSRKESLFVTYQVKSTDWGPK